MLSWWATSTREFIKRWINQNVASSVVPGWVFADLHVCVPESTRLLADVPEACNKDVVQKRDDWRTQCRPEVKEGRERINRVTKSKTSQNSDYSYFRHARSPIQELLLLHKAQRCNCIIRKHLRLEKTFFTHQRLRHVTPVGLFKAGLGWLIYSTLLLLCFWVFHVGACVLSYLHNCLYCDALWDSFHERWHKWALAACLASIRWWWRLKRAHQDKCPLWSEPK